MATEKKERSFNQMQTEKHIIDTLKEDIIKSLQGCTDFSLLDFIHKMITSETQRSKNNAL